MTDRIKTTFGQLAPGTSYSNCLNPDGGVYLKLKPIYAGETYAGKASTYVAGAPDRVVTSVCLSPEKERGFLGCPEDSREVYALDMTCLSGSFDYNQGYALAQAKKDIASKARDRLVDSFMAGKFEEAKDLGALIRALETM